jgi:hypothetical protein
MASGEGPMKTRPASWQACCELRVLCEKPVAGVHGLRAARTRGVDDRGDVQVALCGQRFADPRGLVGLPHVLRIGVGA